jgi:hypothetical protein
LSFYVRGQNENEYVAQVATTGPWDKRLQHGSPVASLLGTRIERQLPPGMRISQFALEFLSPVPVATLDVRVSLVRPGKKIAYWNAVASVAGKDVARVSAWAMAVSPNRSPLVHLEDSVPPPMPETAVTTYFEAVPHFPYGDALEWRFASGGFVEMGPATVWSRLKMPVVEGEEVSPLARVLGMIDSANGISGELDVGKYLFVPVNLSVTLARHPVGEWTGMAAKTSIADDGVGITNIDVFDQRGALGSGLQSLFIEKRESSA